MWKYIYWIFIGLGSLVSKGVGIFYTVLVVRWRNVATNRVHNYVLENGIFLKRLTERNITWNEDYKQYSIFDKNGSKTGYITYHKVNTLEFVLWFVFVYMWLDADTVFDTMDDNDLAENISGERVKWLPDFLRKQLVGIELKGARLARWDCGDDVTYNFHWLGSFLWNLRNTAYNWNYFFHDMQEGDSRWFYIHIESIGWHFGYLPFTYPNGEKNVSHGGRYVFGSEDYKILQ